ncbi:MAG: HupE/UreJ family protein [Devosia sp.]|nr:HupE/UreJ family protein [Devosia sp.]
MRVPKSGLGLPPALLLLTTEALAHHALGGLIPIGFGRGCCRGLAHPVIEVDHLAFVLAVGVLTAVSQGGLSLPVWFVGGTIAGCLLNAGSLQLQPAGWMVPLSALLIGGYLASGRSDNGHWHKWIFVTAGLCTALPTAVDHRQREQLAAGLPARLCHHPDDRGVDRDARRLLVLARRSPSTPTPASLAESRRRGPDRALSGRRCERSTHRIGIGDRQELSSMRLSKQSNYAGAGADLLCGQPLAVSAAIRDIGTAFGVSEMFLFKILVPVDAAACWKRCAAAMAGVRLGAPADTIRIMDVLRVTGRGFRPHRVRREKCGSLPSRQQVHLRDGVSVKRCALCPGPRVLHDRRSGGRY